MMAQCPTITMSGSDNTKSCMGDVLMEHLITVQRSEIKSLFTFRGYHVAKEFPTVYNEIHKYSVEFLIVTENLPASHLLSSSCTSNDAKYSITTVSFYPMMQSIQ